MSRKSFVFEIISFHDCDGREGKIRSAVGADLVRIDHRRGHVVVSTSKRWREVISALENKTMRKVVFVYEIHLPNPKPASQNPQQRASNLQSMSRRSFVFEIISFHDCDGREGKIQSAVGADLVRIDHRRGHVVVSTSKRRREVISALENKTMRKVVFLYEIHLPNPKSASQNPQQRGKYNGKGHGSATSTSDRVSAEVNSSRMTVTFKHQPGSAVVNAPPRKRSQNTSSATKRLKSYHRHGLTLIKTTQSSYKCSGCKELGFGDRYECKDCTYVLHPDCMYYKETATHEFLSKSTFKFHQRPFDSKDRVCNACGSDILGFFYHCERTSKDLHPCCLNLPKTVPVGDMKFQLSKELTSKCFYCNSKKKKNDYKDKCWCYSIKSEDVCEVHVSCMKAAILKCFDGGRNDEKRWSMVIVKHDKQVLQWAQKLLTVVLSVLSGNPFPLFTVALELLE